MSKKSIHKTLLALFTILLISCSSDTDCNQVLEPSGNEFTVNCNRYSTPIGQLSINRPSPNTELETVSCKLQFVNNENGNGFNFQDEEDNNINFVDIWLTIPVEDALLDQIPEGVYTLNNNPMANPYDAFDIVGSNRVFIGASVNDRSFIDYDKKYTFDFDDAVVNVSKSGSQYIVEYTLVHNGTTIKGKFIGELSVVDNWA